MSSDGKQFLKNLMYLSLACAGISFTVVCAFILFNFIHYSQSNVVYTYAVCTNDSAFVFVSAYDKLRNVTCICLDDNATVEKMIVLGDLNRGDEDVCKFTLKKTNEPLRFEIRYNDGKRIRTVCKTYQTSVSNQFD